MSKNKTAIVLVLFCIISGVVGWNLRRDAGNSSVPPMEVNAERPPEICEILARDAELRGAHGVIKVVIVRTSYGALKDFSPITPIDPSVRFLYVTWSNQPRSEDQPYTASYVPIFTKS